MPLSVSRQESAACLDFALIPSRLLRYLVREEHWLRYPHVVTHEWLPADLVLCCFFHSVVLDRSHWSQAFVIVHDQRDGCRDGRASRPDLPGSIQHFGGQECWHSSGCNALRLPRCIHYWFPGDRLGIPFRNPTIATTTARFVYLDSC